MDDQRVSVARLSDDADLDAVRDLPGFPGPAA